MTEAVPVDQRLGMRKADVCEPGNQKTNTGGAHWLTPLRSLLFWSALPFVALQALRVRKSALRLQAADGLTTGQTGDGPALRLLAIGDSIIAGAGASTLDKALVGQTARALSTRLDCAVAWQAHGRIGVDSAQLLACLLPTLAATPADTIIISIGVNDVASLTGIRAWSSNLRALFEALGAHSPDAIVAFAGLPPLREFPLLPEPLRRLIGFRGETLDDVARRLIEAYPQVFHVRVEFETREDSFSADGFHPSETSYREFGEAMAAELADRLIARQAQTKASAADRVRMRRC